MEKIEQFLNTDNHDGSGSGAGSGSRDGCGHGESTFDTTGFGDVFGSGSGFGCALGEVDGYGYGCGYEDSRGYGHGYCYDSNYSDIKTFNGDTVYKINGLSTIIKQVKNNIAKGFILKGDFTLTPCYIVKGDNSKFAHGETIPKAFENLQSNR